MLITSWNFFIVLELDNMLISIIIEQWTWVGLRQKCLQMGLTASKADMTVVEQFDDLYT